MAIFWVILTAVVLMGLLTFRFKAELSRYEINRLAEHGQRYKNLAKFLDIYPGLLTVTRILALIDAILLTTLAALNWGVWGGGTVAFVAILLAWLVSRMFQKIAQELINQHIGWFNKYGRWAGVLGKLIIIGDQPPIGSEHELAHLIETGDFLDDETKSLIKNALTFHGQTVASALTPRDRVAFVHTKDSLTPVLLDELFNSGHKIFPVVQGNLDKVVGLLLLEDVLPLGQDERILTQAMRKLPPPIDQAAPLESALRQMCEYHSTLLMVEKDGRLVGLITLGDIIDKLFKPID
jgi:Mg2+/Co2+ transporter CorB